jgi:hypothetical protein
VHSTGGELYIGRQDINQQENYFFNAVKEKGYKIKDLNGDQSVGKLGMFSDFKLHVHNISITL